MTDHAPTDQEAALFLAIKTQDAALLRELVRADPALLTAPSPMGVSPVLFATYYGRHEMALVLLDEGAPLTVFEAAAVGNVPALQNALDVDPEAAHRVSPDGFSPLGLAAFFGRAEAAELLLMRGADINAVSQNAMRVQPLHSAVAGRHAALARALVMAGADVNAAQQDDFTPLMAAAQNGDSELVAFLQSHGADAGVTTADGRRAADFAREEGHAALAGRLADS
ncbi:ankyrin repeat domain-containing protein [Deinococcus sp. HMF7620]|uniref:Ankyrin repeat domain-containing protein n=1 Tax=Deinococcus arboris TaxID=2682977 RepID=A0A7C9HYX8_9DEIO|nr:ankyrin repeat domain-containing protein [Deinococcus arboris]MVN87348.1 ankyrin repeat domain-containing protein [Deinococcus arboris]